MNIQEKSVSLLKFLSQFENNNPQDRLDIREALQLSKDELEILSSSLSGKGRIRSTKQTLSITSNGRSYLQQFNVTNMEEMHFKILEFLSRQTEPVSADNFPEEIKGNYANGIKVGSLLYELIHVLKESKGWIESINTNPHFFINEQGLKAFKTERLKLLTDGQIKHEILAHLIKKQDSNYEFSEIEESFPINSDRLLYLLHEMNEDGSIMLVGFIEEDNNPIAMHIMPKGIGTYTKREYLNPKEPVTTFVQYNNTTHGNNSPIAGKDVTIRDIKTNDESAEDKGLARKSFKLNQKMLAWTIISIVVAVLLAVKWEGFLSWFRIHFFAG